LPVGEIADRLGYEQPSAFVASFRKAFGVTPAKYFSDEQPTRRTGRPAP
jgi:AraC-like DNA-binding protein